MTKESSKKGRPPGFALVITVILLALLMLALVSTATLTHIEASIGYNSRRDAQAKQNALFALNRAFGELQLHGGPDRRISAEADIRPGTVNNHHWSGIWNAEGGLRTWLVSGNEDLVQPSDLVSDVNNSDQDPGREIYEPTLERQQRSPTSGGWGPWSPLDAPTDEVGRDSYYRNEFRFDSNRPAALLVGPFSAHYGSSSGIADRYVLAPLVDLAAPPADGGSDVIFGRYAWWVGDEGVKARINLVDPRTKSGDKYYSPTADVLPNSVMRHQVPQRTGAESLAGFEDIAPNDPDLEKVLERNQMDFVGATLPGLRQHFHDVTTASAGVLSDPVNGGLKFDLTPFLLNGEDASVNATRLRSLLGITSGDFFHGVRINPSGADTSTFGLLKSWWDLGAGNPDSATPQKVRAVRPGHRRDGASGHPTGRGTVFCLLGCHQRPSRFNPAVPPHASDLDLEPLQSGAKPHGSDVSHRVSDRAPFPRW